METAPAASPAEVGARPTIPLPKSALVRISAFWLGLTSIDAVVNAAVQSRLKFDHLVEPGTEGRSLALVAAASFFFAIAVQPTVGAISDYASTRWGRRKPFIVAGALFDALFLIGIASANSLLAIAAFVTLLSLSTNVARGPFQGYVPDLVPEEQVGLASSMVGLMQVLGNVLGFGLAAIANSQG
ncbi:MAG TPA: MFS transporter, partial [Candidatus Limnocylindrales bacterium]